MRIVALDPSGCGLGLCIGLADLGHDVTYHGLWNGQPTDGFGTDLCRRFAGHRFGTRRSDADLAARIDGCDVLLGVDVFADYLHALTHAIDTAAPMDAADPFAPTRNPLVYPARLARWLDLAARAPRFAVVDASDAAGPREEAFAALPHAVCFARERTTPDPAWRPFPFLYNNVLLAVEHLVAERDWLLPRSSATDHDWLFCGTLRHPRYGDRRLRGIATAHRRWPQLRGHVVVDAPFVEVLNRMQRTRHCLDLPGAGELCFRLHEALATGTPLLRLAPGAVALPTGLADVVVQTPLAAPIDPELVRTRYREHYAPRAAAATLLQGLAAPRTLVRPPCPTPLVPAHAAR
ncbi:MAG: hypothetical protein JNL08_08905 [Planctomycetes bacterium]|nr:hypothetical protein [Planctomycetota bacterium]